MTSLLSSPPIRKVPKHPNLIVVVALSLFLFPLVECAFTASSSLTKSSFDRTAIYKSAKQDTENSIGVVQNDDTDANDGVVGAETGAETGSNSDDDQLTYFKTLAGNAVNCLIKGDLKRKKGGDGGSTGWTSWVEESSSYQLKCCVNALSLSTPENPTDINGLKQDLLYDRDETLGWTRWLKASPAPLMIELSHELRNVADEFIYDNDLANIESTRQELLDRMGLRLITLPSGKSLNEPIRTPPGAIAFGKLLWGGANRFKLLPGKYQRKAGERLAIKTQDDENVDCWMQFGGPERNYEAVDMGPCAILEIIILPKGLKFENAFEEKDLDGHMTLTQLSWDPSKMFQFYHPKKNGRGDNKGNNQDETKDDDDSEDGLIELSGKERNDFLEDYFTETVGGLRPQIEAIVRRVLDGRVFRAYDDDGEGESVGVQSLLDAKELESLGLNPVRGLLLYGPPGCGKTALAREISQALFARKPKIVAAPELLDRWVGGSEKLVRSLFTDAEQELNACGGDATKSSLHVIVIDEIDAVFRKRSASEDSASTTRASAVNQILAKLDGVKTLSNVLLIGMTNRRDLLDEALLRPGRLEVQIEIPLPTEEGRREILQIHFEALRRRGRLSEPLCRAIDGPKYAIDRLDSDQKTISFRSTIKQVLLPRIRIPITTYGNRLASDLAADRVTKGFSGADIQGLVRCSGSIALAKARQQGMGLEGLLITLEDVIEALDEIQR